MTAVLDPAKDHHDDTDERTARVLAAPSGTHLRFLMLVMAAMATDTVVAAVVYFAIEPHGEYHRTVLTQCAAVLRAGTDFDPGALTDCTEPATLAMMSWVGRALAVQLGLVLLLYAAHPWWVRRRGRLRELDGDADPELRDELAALLAGSGLRRRPQWLLAPYSYGYGGQAFGLPWRPRVQLDAGLRVLLVTDRPRFRAVVLHELAHLRNRDVGVTYLTVAVWWVLVGTSLPGLLLLPVVGAGTGGGWRTVAVLASVLALTALVHLARTSVLRAREHYADVAAAAAGSRTAMLAAIEVLTWPPRTGGPGRWFARHGFHPSPRLRCDVVGDPVRLLRTGAGDVVFFGVAAGVALTNLLFSVPATAGATPGSALACLVTATALTLFLAACARRAVARAHPAPPRGAQTWGVPVLLALSLSAGSVISVLSAFTGETGGPGPGASLLPATALLCLGTVVLHLWFTSAHRASWPPGRRTPLLTALIVPAGAVYLFFWVVNSAQLGAVRLGPPPAYGADIAWYDGLARLVSTTYLPVVTAANLPLGLTLVVLACVPLLTARGTRPPLRSTVVTGLFAGGGALLAAAALPVAARWALPVSVRHPDTEFHLGGPATFGVVLLYGYGLATAVAVLAATAVVAARADRLRPPLVTLAAVVTVTTAAPGLYLLRTTARCLDVYADGASCAFRGAPPGAHTQFLDTVLAWTGIVAVPVALLAAAAGTWWRSRRPPVAVVPEPRGAGPSGAGPRAAGPRAARARVVLPVVAAVAVGAVFAATELPRLAVLLLPASAGPEVAVDGCLRGWWVERSRRQPQMISTTATAPYVSSGLLWSFTGQGTAALYLGDTTARAEMAPRTRLAYLSAGVIRWRYRTGDGSVTFTDPTVSATLTGVIGDTPRGTLTLQPDDAAGYALPGTYTCAGDTLTASSPGYAVTLHRVGAAG